MKVPPVTWKGHYESFSIADLLIDEHGTIRIGLESGDLIACHYGPTGVSEWHRLTEPDGPTLSRIPFLLDRGNGAIWVVSLQKRAGVAKFEGGVWTHESFNSIGGSDMSTSILETASGSVIVAGNLIYRSVQGQWRKYDGLGAEIPSHRLRIIESIDGSLWVLGLGQHLSYLDFSDRRWYSLEDLSYEGEDARGHRWYLTGKGRVIEQLEQSEWIEYDVTDGLPDLPSDISISPIGRVWCSGTTNDEVWVASLDGNRWKAVRSGLKIGRVEWNSVYFDRDGGLWVITDLGSLGHYDETSGEWSNPRSPDVPNFTVGICQTDDGTVWAGGSSLCRFDGERWERESGLDKYNASFVTNLFPASDGTLWVGTRTYGLFSLRSSQWMRHSVESGLAGNDVRDIIEGSDGSIWANTSQGVSRWDGNTWTTRAVDPSVGTLPIWHMESGSNDTIWLNQRLSKTSYGTIRYRQERIAPETSIQLSVQDVLAGQEVPFTWTGVDFLGSTIATDLEYSYALDEEPWSSFAKDTSHLLISLDPGNHHFRVRARDQDFNVDPTPALAEFSVTIPVTHRWWFQVGVAGVIMIFAYQARKLMQRTAERDRARQALLQELEDELDTAREMQMDLMPREPVAIPGYDIDGVCHPANHVGGDYYQFFQHNGTLNVAMADVTGHAMEAAIPVVMFSGILETQIEVHTNLLDLLSRLNRSMVRSRRGRTFVCFCMAEVDLETRVATFSNAGYPYPYVYHARSGELEEVQIDSYPLGIRDGITFEAQSVPLVKGDYVVFCSDGIVEAENTDGQQFGYDETHGLVQSLCAQSLAAREVIDIIVAKIETHRGDTAQSDDLTCVVIKVTA